MSTLRVLACAASLFTTITAATAQPVAVEFDAALEAYERNHWPDAYRAMSRLADDGHAEAARIALQMRRYGRGLYGLSFDATPQQEQRWAQLRPCGADLAVQVGHTAVAPPVC